MKPPGARLARPGLCRRRPRRRGATLAGAARGPAGLARPSSPQPPQSRCIPGRSRSGPERRQPGVLRHSGLLRHSGRTPGRSRPGAGARSSRPGLRLHRPRRRGAPRAGAARGPAGSARPGLLLLTLRFVISCAIASSIRANGRTQPEWAGRGSAPATRRDLSSCACAFTRWSLPVT